MFIYEFPLSPRARTYLKLEQVFKNAELSSDLSSIQNVMFLLRAVVDFIDLVDGSSAIKIELLKDLEKCDGRLKGWLTDPECDKDFVALLREKSFRLFYKTENCLKRRSYYRTYQTKIFNPKWYQLL